MDDEEVLALNMKITKLLTENESLFQENIRLSKVNEKLNQDLDTHCQDSQRTSQKNMQFKFDLEKEQAMRQSIFEAHQKQKSKFLSLYEQNYKMGEKVKLLENTIESMTKEKQAKLARHSSLSFDLPTRHSMCGSLLNSSMPSNAAIINLALEDLKKKIHKLESELMEAYSLIDELEFEVDSIPFYENENERLRNKLRELKQQYETDEPDSTDADEEVREKSKLDQLYQKLQVLHEKQCNNSTRSHSSSSSGGAVQEL